MNLPRMFKNQKGMTLIELLVVIGITASVTGLGIIGLIRFRQTVTLRQASREFFTAVEDARNKAKNSVLSTAKPIQNGALDAKVDGYAIVFESDGDYSMLYCHRSDSTSVDFICDPEQTNLRSSVFNKVNFTVHPDSSCAGVLFEDSTGRLKLFENLDSINFMDDVCLISIKFSNTILEEIVELDSINDKFSYKVGGE